MIKLTKLINEKVELQSFPQGGDDLAKAERLREVAKNKFLSITVEEGLTNLPSAQKLLEDIDKAGNIVSKLADKYEEKDEEKFDQLSDVQHDLVSMYNCLYDIVNAFEANQHLIKNLKL
jgi:hypothetical protein